MPDPGSLQQLEHQAWGLPDNQNAAVPSSRLGTCATRMQFAIPTLEDTPVWPGVTNAACPLDQRIIQLDELE